MMVENVDFTWVERSNGYGFSHSYPMLKDGKVLKRVSNPRPNMIVLYCENNKLVPVLIKEGQYEVNGRISNFWYWHEVNDDMSLSEIKHGYGHFYESNVDYKIELKVSKLS